MGSRKTKWALGLLGCGLVSHLAFPACAAAAATTHAFNIPAQDLATALEAFGRQSGTAEIFDRDALAGKRSSAVVGTLDTKAALDRLLGGTGLSARNANGNTFVIGANATKGEAIAGSAAANDGSAVTGGEETSEVVVTGSHVRGAATASPTIIIDRQYIDQSGVTTAGDLVRTLPQNFGGGDNPTLSIHTGPGQYGSSSNGSAPNLRGLGPSSTLTLVNGHRLAEDYGAAIDVSGIPLAAIERVEVVTDGASASYGSDAVAGVVNYILRSDYDGAETSGLIGAPTQGGGREIELSQTAGKSWGSGSLLGAYEYENQRPIEASQRSFSKDASSPFTLYPATRRNSLFLSGHQDLTSDISVFADGIYTKRYTENSVPYVSYYTQYNHVQEYYGTAGFDIRLPASWRAKIYGTLSHQQTDLKVDAYVGLPSAYSYSEALKGNTKVAEADLDGILFKLPAGSVRTAVGAGYREENFGIFDGGTVSQYGKRHVGYVFGEVVVPLVNSDHPGLHRLELNASGRYEHYSEFGDNAVPKLGILYQPIESVTLRGTWGRSYRAPALDDTTSLRYLSLFSVADPQSTTGKSLVLVRQAGNADLKPERAHTLSASAEWKPMPVPGLRFFGDYYRISYSNRIASLPTIYTALTDPAYAPFVSRSPSAQAQSELIAQADGGFFNQAGVPYDPSQVAAVLDARPINIAYQRAEGADVGISYDARLGTGKLSLFLNGTYLDLWQRLTPSSGRQQLSGIILYPVKTRFRSGGSFSLGGWTFFSAVNFTGHSRNIYVTPSARVASQATFDSQISYKTDARGLLGGLKFDLSVLNLLDKDPPYALLDVNYKGVHYDPTNGSPIGRFVSFRITKSW